MAEKVKPLNWMDVKKKIFKSYEFPDTGNVADDTVRDTVAVVEEEEELDWEVGQEDIENGSKGTKERNDEEDHLID